LLFIKESKNMFNFENSECNDTIKYLRIMLFILIIAFIIIAIICLYEKYTDNFDDIHSDIDGKYYHVRSSHTDIDKKQTANYLATISNKVDKLVQYMVDHNSPSPEIAQRLKKRWGTCSFKETASTEKSAAYTVNKGDEMRLCVRNNKNKLENMNTSMFVILHELGHVMSNSYGHNDEFRQNFSYIVHLASSLGFYKPEDFGDEPVDYCNVQINTSPCQGGTCDYTSIPTAAAYATF
jgi:hypothetical protein